MLLGGVDLEYKPSLLAKVARLIIPVLRTVLPSTLFIWIYDALYFIYKKLARCSYASRLLRVILFKSNRIDQICARLTWKLLPYTMGGYKALENAFHVVEKIERKAVLGALVECGVAEGGAAAMLALANKELHGLPRDKWFFDSYEGLPEPTKEDYIDGRAGSFVRPLPKGSCLGTLEQVSELMFETLRLPASEIKLIKGWFQDTVPQHAASIGQIAVLRLDGDWYESTLIPLEHFFPKLESGGVVIVDDYGTCHGSKRATDEYRERFNITTPLRSDGRGGVWFEKA